MTQKEGEAVLLVVQILGLIFFLCAGLYVLVDTIAHPDLYPRLEGRRRDWSPIFDLSLLAALLALGSLRQLRRKWLRMRNEPAAAAIDVPQGRAIPPRPAGRAGRATFGRRGRPRGAGDPRWARPTTERVAGEAAPSGPIEPLAAQHRPADPG